MTKCVSVRDGTTNEQYKPVEQEAVFGKLLFLSRHTATHLALFSLDKWRLVTHLNDHLRKTERYRNTVQFCSYGLPTIPEFEVFDLLSLLRGVCWKMFKDISEPTYFSISRRLLRCLTIADETKNISETSVICYRYMSLYIQQERSLEIQAYYTSRGNPRGFVDLGANGTWRLSALRTGRLLKVDSIPGSLVPPEGLCQLTI